MSRSPATKNTAEREDSLANRATVRTAMLAFIKQYLRPPTVAELVAATGLSANTVKAHRQRVRLGDGKPNDYQQLTSDVMMAIFERATGYKHEAVKILAVSQGGGLGAEVQEVPYTEHYPPDPAMAKLWMQLVEGFTEKSEKKHSGEVGMSLKFNYVAPAPPQPEGGPDVGN